jgi:peptidoglycan/LPS O-acetylase OafA/YrhL
MPLKISSSVQEQGSDEMKANLGSSQKPRMIGIDLFRGFAIYAVVVLHIDEGVNTLPNDWNWITDFALFAVPFFLATAFYFAIGRLYHTQKPYPLYSRLLRLIIPYSCWSILYLAYRFSKYTITGESTKIMDLFSDPISIIFFGGAAFHLYFIPLLISGTFLIKGAEFLIKRNVRLKHLLYVALISLVLYEVVLAIEGSLQGNDSLATQPIQLIALTLDQYSPFSHWLKTELFWMLRCLPYVMMAMILAHPANPNGILKISKYNPVLWVFVFLTCNIFGDVFLPSSLHELARGFTALIAAIALSNDLKIYTPIRQLGFCSFGIYLIHLFFVEVFQSAAVRIEPDYTNSISTITLVSASIVVFLISWITVTILTNYSRVSKILFGA